jgi:hypothetical protein
METASAFFYSRLKVIKGENVVSVCSLQFAEEINYRKRDAEILYVMW